MRSDAVVLERAKGPSREGPFALSALLFSYREPAEDQRRREKPSDAGAIVHTKGESTLGGIVFIQRNLESAISNDDQDQLLNAFVAAINFRNKAVDELKSLNESIKRARVRLPGGCSCAPRCLRLRQSCWGASNTRRCCHSRVMG